MSLDSTDRLQIEPKKFRLFFVVLFLLLMTLIWSGSLIGLRAVKANLVLSLKERIESDTLVLEDHASRALDTVSARLESLVPLTTADAIRVQSFSSYFLRQFVFEDRIIRSLSLVDPNRKVLASSTEDNEGIVLPQEMFPGPGARFGQSGVQYGNVYPFRDLYQVGDAKLANDIFRFWVATLPVNVDGAVYHWVLTVNLSLFSNLWERTDKNESTEITLLSYRGERIVTHHQLADIDQKALFKLIIDQVQDRQRGTFEFNAGRPILVSYRGSSDHPVVLAEMGDVDAFLAEHADEQQRFIWGAAVLSLALGIVMLLLYRWYLRYELSVIEMSNQSRAIGAHLLVSESDIGGRITNVNPSFLKTTGYELDEVIGQHHRMFNSGMYSKEYYASLWQTITAGKIWKGTFRNKHKNGGYYWVNATIVPYRDAWDKVTRFVAFYTDITDAVSHSEKFEHERRLRENLARINQELISDANTDVLTGVANRRAFATFADQMLKTASELTYPVSVLMLDLDFFKRINDRHGHQAGDEVLLEVTKRWGSLIRSSDLLARLGGEEFGVLLHNATGAQAQLVAEKLLKITAAKPVPCHDAKGRLVEVSASVSIGLASADSVKGMLMDDLMRLADAALYEAKHAGRNRLVVKRLN